MAYIKNLLGSDETVLFEARRHAFVLAGQFLKELLVLGVIIAGWLMVYGSGCVHAPGTHRQAF